MSKSAEQLRTAADSLRDARSALDHGDLDVDTDPPEGAPSPEEIVTKIDEQIGGLQLSLQELAANVNVMEEVDEHD